MACSGTPAKAPVADGGRADGGRADGGPAPDGGGTLDGGITCPNTPLPVPSQGSCTFTAGDDNLLLQGTVLLPGKVLRNAHVLVLANGNIACADCDCSGQPTFATA